jgi:hypothetical protein
MPGEPLAWFPVSGEAVSARLAVKEKQSHPANLVVTIDADTSRLLSLLRWAER